MDNQVAVVTGGTRGIGLGIAEKLLDRGAAVAITYHSDESSAKNAREHLKTVAVTDKKILPLKEMS